MITGDNPLTAVHVARDVEIVDRDVLILDVKDSAGSQSGELQVVLRLLLRYLRPLRPGMAHCR